MTNKYRFSPYLLIFPAILVMGLMVAYPLFYGIGLSFTNMSLKTFRNPAFNGIKNYIDVLGSPQFYFTAWRTIEWTIINVFFHVTLGLFLALLLNRDLPGKNFFRTILMIPWAVPQYIAVITWKNMFRGQYGTIDILLNKFGITDISWLTDPVWTFRAAIITNIWLGVPFMMAVIYGALQSIPKEMYEAGEIDGVKSFNKHRYITLPLLKPVLAPAVVLGTVWTFNMVNVIFIMTENTGHEVTQILVTKVYRDAFIFFGYGRAAATSVIIFLMLALFSVVYLKITKGSEGVYD